jgi:hypothetical protein
MGRVFIASGRSPLNHDNERTDSYCSHALRQRRPICLTRRHVDELVGTDSGGRIAKRAITLNG